MHPNAVAAFVALLLPLASAKCYGDVPPNTNKQFAFDNIYNSATLLQGHLDAGQVRGVCVSDVNQGNHWYFSVRNVGKTGQTIKKDLIEKYLNDEVRVCNEGGGFSEYNYIHYKYVDPRALLPSRN